MNNRMEVFTLGKGRIAVFGAKRGSIETESIHNWLTSHSAVLRVVQSKQTDRLTVYFNDRGDSGRLARSLKEMIHALQVVAPSTFNITIVHSTAGRVRLRTEGLNSRQILGLASFSRTLPGIKSVETLSGSNTLLVFYDRSVTTQLTILNSLKKTDPAHLLQHQPTPPVRWGGAATGTLVLAACVSRAFPMPWMAVGITLVSLRPLSRSIRALIDNGKFSIDALDVAATYAALATGRPITAAFVIWMEGVGDLLLDISASSARNALSKLARNHPREVCRILPSGESEYISSELLKPGDLLLCQTGQAIAADGRVVRGWAEIDEKALTGESHLVAKSENDTVFASTVVVEGQIVIVVSVVGKNTEAAKIEQVLSTVGDKPLTLQRDALEFGGKLVPPTFGMAGMAATFASNVTPAVCVLVTDFGTGIRISVPTSALTAMTLAARENILVKGAQYLERLAKTDVIIFDKTGTLTNGVPEVVEVLTCQGIDERTVVHLGASAEARQEHPVAKALRSHALKLGVGYIEPEAETEEHTVGKGHSAQVTGQRVRVGRASWMEEQNLSTEHFKKDLLRLRTEQISSLCLAIDDKVVGVIGYSDGSRPESASIIQKLRANGRRRVILLSGDSDEVVRKIAQEVGIEEAVGSLLPDQKADYVRRLKAEGHVVAMIGDGINDAPALALADVGISIAGSTEVALETADIVLLEGGLVRLPRAFKISDQTMARVKQNLGVVIVPNAIAICLGAMGLISPPIAAVINNGATLAAVMTGTLPLLWTRDRRKLSPAPFVGHDDRKTSLVSVPAQARGTSTLLHAPKLAPLRSTNPMPKGLAIENSPENGIFARFEEKYFLPKKNLAPFKTEISDFFTHSSPIPGTRFTDIESVYLDSPDFQIYRMHFSGLQERFKIRARKYAPNGVPGDGSAHIEYKSKKDGVSRKSRFQVGPREFGLLWSGHKIPSHSKGMGKRNQDLEDSKLKERVNWINSLVAKNALLPSCIVRYRREAFEGGDLRLTIDDQIHFEKTRTFADMKGFLVANPELNAAATRMRSAFLSGEYLLVEVKHPGAIPVWLTDILTKNECQKAKFSKYCYSITEALLTS